MTGIRYYQNRDAIEVGKLIADTYTKFNLGHVAPDELSSYLGPFTHAYSTDQNHIQAIAGVIRADITLVAEKDSKIAGILRGRPEKLQSLFVRDTYQRQGVGRALVSEFEKLCRVNGSREIKVQATLYAVSFYLAVGYKRSTGVRRMTSFEGRNLPYQPMKKHLPKPNMEDQG